MTDNVLNINISLETAKCCRVDHPGSLIIFGNPQEAIKNCQASLKGPLEQGGWTE